MTDEDIQKAWRDIGGADGRMILPLYEFARSIIAQARAEAFEEAARVCDSVDNYANPMTAQDCADAIRALIPDTKE